MVRLSLSIWDNSPTTWNAQLPECIFQARFGIPEHFAGIFIHYDITI
ncbi:MAG: hypothetical protein E7B11_02470 [Clostridiales bacterium]|nr:hypothetical protein [Clostridiales bacterium]